MKALTVDQPWAWAILQGLKRRSRRIPRAADGYGGFFSDGGARRSARLPSA